MSIVPQSPADPQPPKPPVLSERHYKELHEGSGIADSVILQRGAFTATDRDQLRALDFPDFQARPPGYVLPLHSLNGWDAQYLYKPDDPRTEIKDSGKVRVIKYERPKGAANRLDVPPACVDAVSDPSTPLLFTEGVKKGDAGATHGLAVVVLSGVWNWRRRNRDGESIPLEDFDHLPLEGRKVAICFDSDASRNANVRLAEETFACFLASRGALVSIVRLPDADDGSKQGLDDYLLRHPAWRVWALAESALAVRSDNQPDERAARWLQSATARAMTNKRARKLLPVATRFIGELLHAKESGREPDTPDGLYRVPRALIGGKHRETGEWAIAERTVSNHLRELADLAPDIPSFRAETRAVTIDVPWVNRETGEVGTEPQIVPTLVFDYDGAAAQFMDALATLPLREERRGGARTCDKCGSDLQVVRTCPTCDDARAARAPEGGPPADFAPIGIGVDRGAPPASVILPPAKSAGGPSVVASTAGAVLCGSTLASGCYNGGKCQEQGFCEAQARREGADTSRLGPRLRPPNGVL